MSDSCLRGAARIQAAQDAGGGQVFESIVDVGCSRGFGFD